MEAIEWLVSAGMLNLVYNVSRTEPRYFSDKRGEIDFVVQNGTEIIPIEVKGGEDKSALSFKYYVSKHTLEHALRFSRRGYVINGGITNFPLYLARKTRELL